LRTGLAEERAHWPPDYNAHFAWRTRQRAWLCEDPRRIESALEYYRTRPVAFIEHWGITFDPRNLGREDRAAYMPFIMFERQRQLIEFLTECVRDQQSGLVEKARDMGATWTCCAFSVHQWLFVPGAAIGWGSRLLDLVDRVGIKDSIFEKIRDFIRWMPPEFWPKGFWPEEHMPFLRIINPENGATIAGEGGDNMGRGGRKTMYFKDESAHYARPDLVEAALTSNTAVQIDISSVHGLGGAFQRRREAGQEWEPGRTIAPGITRVFVMDWRHNPAKTQDWYDREKRRYINEGNAHIWAQEVDRNYAASVIGTIIPREWVVAAVDAHKKLGFGDDGAWGGALDVADGGADTNAIAIRKGNVLKHVEEWVAPDAAVTARRAIGLCRPHMPDPPFVTAFELQYDCIGVGSTVKAEGNRLHEERLLPRGFVLAPWNAGDSPLNADKPIIPGDRQSPLNGDFYANLKAQGWWQLRGRFERTWRAVTHKELTELATLTDRTLDQQRRFQALKEALSGALEDPLGDYTYDDEDLIAIDAEAIPLATRLKLEKELSQPTIGYSSKLKLLVNKQPDGTKSPNLADSVMMAFWPVPTRRMGYISPQVLARAGTRG